VGLKILIKKRENYRIVVPQEYKDAIDAGICPVCKKPKIEWTRTTSYRCCSKLCTEEYGKHIFLGWGPLRLACFKRDLKCLKCSVVHTKIVDVTSNGFEYYDFYEIILKKEFFKKTEYYDVFKCELFDMSAYVADHIFPIALGGDEWDINNLQTLCIACNKKKTKEDMKKIAFLRRKDKLSLKGQIFLQ
jgi:hypothetical protein